MLQLTSPSVPKPMIRLAAATSLRNAFVTSRNWDRPPQAVEDENHAHFSEADKEAVRGTIIEVRVRLVGACVCWRCLCVLAVLVCAGSRMAAMVLDHIAVGCRNGRLVCARASRA